MSLDMPPKSQVGQPAWELATLFPLQGEWSEHKYLSLDTNRLVELNCGMLEVLPMPTELHQLIAQFLYRRLFGLEAGAEGVGGPLGLTLVAPFRVRLPSGKFRQPDVMFMLRANRARRHNQFWEGADLVIEVVSDDDPDRDLVTKRSEYAQANISEYWIVDPRHRSVAVLTLDAGSNVYKRWGVMPMAR